MSQGIPSLSGNETVTAAILNQTGSAANQIDTHKSTAFKVTQWIVGICTLGIGALAMEAYHNTQEIKAASLALDVLSLYNGLSGIPRDSGYTMKTKLGGVDVTLRQDCNGRLKARFAGREIDVPFTAAQLVEKLKNDIVSHPGFYGAEASVTMLGNPGDPVGERERELALLALQSKLGIAPTEAATVRTQTLLSLARNVVRGDITDSHDVIATIRLMSEPQHINGEDTLDLLNGLDAAKKANKPGTAAVVVPETHFTSKSIEAQDPNVTKIRNFMADLIYDNDTWVHDTQSKPGERMYTTLKNHAADIILLCNDKALLDKCGLPEEVTAPLREMLDEIQNAPGAGFALLSSFTLTGALAVKYGSDPALFEGLETRIDQGLEAGAKEIEKQITTALTALDTSGAKKSGRVEEAVDDSEKLNNMLKASTTDMTKPGYGMFMKEVLSHYYSQQSPIDKRAMISASIRYAAAGDKAGAKLGAMLKGAGPIMQKMLQGFDTAAIADKELIAALQDMKSRLAPIPDKIVEAQLYNMVQNSHGSITSITVTQSLGAASVGQAFLCTVKTTAHPEGQECVIKLLRPDVQARAAREREIFENAAKGIPGMDITFAGQLHRIMDELDLTIEAENIKKGVVYDKPYTGNVHSMKMFPLVDPSTSALVLERAPGDTLDTFTRTAKTQLGILMQQSAASPDGFLTSLRGFLEQYRQISDAQFAVANLSARWVTEGIYGGGFYHGDLHAGNIMYDKPKTVDGEKKIGQLTVIDYGNATTLSPEAQTDITRMMAAAAAKNAPQFMKGFRSLLTEEGKKLFDEKNAAISRTFSDILSLGELEDSGTRIAVCLAEAQKLGLELPAPIFNFSQCQIRLQNSINSLNNLMSDVKIYISNAANILEQPQLADILKPLATNENFGKEDVDACIKQIETTLEGLEGSGAADKEKIRGQLNTLRDILRELSPALRKPQDFSDCMAGVIRENMGSSLARIGAMGSYSMLRA